MRPITPILVSCLCLAILAGCGVTPPARYYILTPVGFGGESGVPGPALGIGPVDFQRSQVVNYPRAVGSKLRQQQCVHKGGFGTKRVLDHREELLDSAWGRIDPVTVFALAIPDQQQL